MATITVHIHALTEAIKRTGEIPDYCLSVGTAKYSNAESWVYLGSAEINYYVPANEEIAAQVVASLRAKRLVLMGKNAEEITRIDREIQTWLALPNEVPHDPA